MEIFLADDEALSCQQGYRYNVTPLFGSKRAMFYEGFERPDPLRRKEHFWGTYTGKRKMGTVDASTMRGIHNHPINNRRGIVIDGESSKG